MTEQTLSIRRYDPADADRLWTIHEQALRESGIEFVEDKAEEDFTKIPERYLETEGEFLVGVLADEVVAMGGYQPRSETCAEIRRMRVHPEYQGRGYGKRMLNELEAHAIERGFKELVLYTNSKLVAARELYTTHGYVVTRRETDDDVGETFIHYRKEVDMETKDTAEN